MVKIRRKKTRRSTSSLSLASEICEPASNLGDYAIMIYGIPGVGKTSLAAGFPESHHFFFGDRNVALPLRQRIVQDWKEAIKYADLFAQSEHRTAVIDVVEMAFLMCVNEVCRREAVNDPMDVAWGKGWKAIRDEFSSWVCRWIDDEKRGVVFVSHVRKKTDEWADGTPKAEIWANLMKIADEVLVARCDVIGYYHFDRADRVLQIRADDDDVLCKCRPNDRFLTPDGTPLKTIPMGDSAEEAIENFRRAFDNEFQPADRAPRRRREVSKKRKRRRR